MSFTAAWHGGEQLSRVWLSPLECFLSHPIVGAACLSAASRQDRSLSRVPRRCSHASHAKWVASLHWLACATKAQVARKEGHRICGAGSLAVGGAGVVLVFREAARY